MKKLFVLGWVVLPVWCLVAQVHQEQAFVANRGQWPSEVLYRGSAPNLTVWITTDGMVLDLFRRHSESDARPFDRHVRSGSVGQVLRLRWKEPRRAAAEGRYPLSAVHHYFIGDDPANWRTHVPLYREVVHRAVFDGVDVRYYYTPEGMFRYDVVVHPGGDVAHVAFTVEGADGVEVDPATGDLVMRTRFGPVRHQGLRAYQLLPSGMKDVSAAFVQRPDGTIGFEVGEYDPQHPLVIDPLLYSTFIGHSGDESAFDITYNTAGEAYLIGYSTSANYPTTSGAYDQTHNGADDIIVSKLNAAGSALVFSTFLGGSGLESGYSIQLDDAGNIYGVGYSTSSNFPTTSGAYDQTHNGGEDVVLFQLNASGSALLFSTYLGGSGNDVGWDLERDATGNIFITGYTASSNFPTTANAYDQTHNGGDDIFLAQLNGSGSSLLFSTFVGGSALDRAFDMVLDGNGRPIVIGYSLSSNYPTTAGVVQTANAGSYDGVVTRFDMTTNPVSLDYSTYFGGSGADIFWAGEADPSHNVVLTGATLSTNFPTSAGAYQTTHQGGTADGVIVKLNSSATAILFSTYFGGSGWDEAYDIEIDYVGHVTTTGYTTSPNFDVGGNNPIDPTYNGGSDIFLLRLNNAGSTLLYGTYLGGSSNEEGWAVKMIGDGDFCVAGYSQSANYPTTSGAYDVSHNGLRDVCVTCIQGPVIPVELMYFKGRCLHGEVVLQWATASEQGALRFQIERQHPQGGWEVVGEVPAKGESVELTEYFFVVPGMQTEPTGYYRLIQEDIDGKRRTSEVIAVSCQDRPSDHVQITPNPSTGQFVISGVPAEIRHAVLYGADGKEWGRAVVAPDRRSSLHLNVGRVPTGTYYLVLAGPDRTLVQRVVVHR